MIGVVPRDRLTRGVRSGQRGSHGSCRRNHEKRAQSRGALYADPAGAIKANNPPFRVTCSNAQSAAASQNPCRRDPQQHRLPLGNL